MKETGNNGKKSIPFRNNSGVGMMRRWAGLCVGILIIWFMMAYAAPWGRHTAMLKPMMDLIEERGIKATAYYYTDLEEFAEAENNITHALRYPPAGP